MVNGCLIFFKVHGGFLPKQTPAACLVDFKWRETTLFFRDTGSLQASQNSLPETTDRC